MKIVEKSGYSGYLPIETLSPKGKPYNPYVVVPAFLKQLREAMAKSGIREAVTPLPSVAPARP
jgi:hypothetical protein